MSHDQAAYQEFPEILEPELRRFAAQLRRVPGWQPDPIWMARLKERLLRATLG